MTASEFYSNVLEILKGKPKRTLEEYLLALYNLIEERDSDHIDGVRFLSFLSDAFYTVPIPFPETWRSYTSAPRQNPTIKGNYTPEELEEIMKGLDTPYFHLQYTLGVIRFQVAELHAMRGKQLENDQRYFGIDSETGHRWYNFDPFTNLECGARSLLDGSEEGEELEINWEFIGDFLERGRCYE